MNVKSEELSEEVIRKKLALIIQEIGNIDIADENSSLFGFQYNLTSELFIYILLRASKEFCFEINDEFIESLGDYSFHNIMNSVVSQASNLIGNSDN